MLVDNSSAPFIMVTRDISDRMVEILVLLGPISMRKVVTPYLRNCGELSHNLSHNTYHIIFNDTFCLWCAPQQREVNKKLVNLRFNIR